jgi:hypothetical protein
MEIEIITIYCCCEDFLISVGHKDDPQSRMSTAEIMTTALTAAAFFPATMKSPDVFSKNTDISRICSQKVSSIDACTGYLNLSGGPSWKTNARAADNPLKTYLTDSFPVPVCRNIRIKNCRIYQDEESRGYNPSKKEYFYGLKVHLLLSESGIPAEMFFSPGAYPGTSALYDFTFPLPEGSRVHGDKAYNVYAVEDELKDREIHLMPVRKKNSKRKYDTLTERGIRYIRKRTESFFSVIEQQFPRHIHAVTPRGFELKILMFVLAFGIQASML